MFDIVTAAYTAWILYASMCVIGVLIAIAYWKRRRPPLFWSALLLGGLLVAFQPWRYMGAFKDPGVLPVWDDDTLEILAIYRTAFIVFIGFLAAYLCCAVGVIRRIRRSSGRGRTVQ